MIPYSEMSKDHYASSAVPSPNGVGMSYHDAALNQYNQDVLMAKKQEYESQGWNTVIIANMDQMAAAINNVTGYGNYAFIYDGRYVSSQSISDNLQNKVNALHTSKVINGYSSNSRYGNDGVSDVWYYTFALAQYKG